MKEIHHLTLTERETIEQAICDGMTKAEMGRMLGKDACGISREIKRHRELVEKDRHDKSIYCKRQKTCKPRGCSKKCAGYERIPCSRRDKSPGACNGCAKRSHCRMDKYHYNAKRANTAAQSLLVSSREGINITPEERNIIGNTIAPLLKNGQSVYQVLETHDEIDLSARTLYRYIESGVFKPNGVDNFSLKEQVNRKQFKEKYKKRKDIANFNGRRYSDYLDFLKLNPDVQTVEMDTVYNNPSGPYLQTFMFPDSHFMIGRLHTEKTCDSMAASLDYYQQQLGFDRFRSLFALILTDRGSEFEKFALFEHDRDGTFRLNIFYCDPMQSAQKPHIENNHNYVRDFIKNGKPMDKLSQDDVDLMFSHINSTIRKSLHGKSPLELFSFYHGNDTAALLGVSSISSDDIILHPSLFKGKSVK